MKKSLQEIIQMTKYGFVNRNQTVIMITKPLKDLNDRIENIIGHWSLKKEFIHK